jgi:nitrogenase subunit NifH
MEPEPVSERMEPEPEPEPDTDYKSSVEEPVNLDNEDVTVLAREIEELESKVNNYQKKEKKRKVGGIINNKKKNREDYINNLVEQKINARMNTNLIKSAPVQQNKTVRPPTLNSSNLVVPKERTAPAPIKKVSKFANTITPLWARGFDI